MAACLIFKQPQQNYVRLVVQVRGRASPVNSSVPAGSQGEVDDHVHGDQISHCIIVGSHGAQDPLSSLNTAGSES